MNAVKTIFILLAAVTLGGLTVHARMVDNMVVVDTTPKSSVRVLGVYLEKGLVVTEGGVLINRKGMKVIFNKDKKNPFSH